MGVQLPRRKMVALNVEHFAGRARGMSRNATKIGCAGATRNAAQLVGTWLLDARRAAVCVCKLVEMLASGCDWREDVLNWGRRARKAGRLGIWKM
jgi:hypothetical protein